MAVGLVGGCAVLVAVALVVTHNRRLAGVPVRLATAAAACVGFAVVVRARRSLQVAIGGAVLAAGGLWVLAQARDGLLAPVLGVVVGAGAGLTVGAGQPGKGKGKGKAGAFVLAPVALALASVTAWTGANSPTATWFGTVVSSGPRSRPQVALTFDDGPNATTTLAVRDILDQAGVKATFFTVGKALDARPDISAALLADGQLLGDHSYHHDSVRWLDPRYPELARTQHAFAARLGVCPALFRPPHGQHTPFMALRVEHAHMRMITWNVSTADWAMTDAGAVTRRILDQVRPGAIIDLHDGLDGHVDVDRTVLVRALPGILDGLRQRGLEPVRLDVLLGTPGYLKHCR